jgi:4-hydroxy-tetrahydrodipicolinate synthase
MFRGTITALATPFRDGEFSRKGLQDLVEFQISEGVDGLVPCGSTGEAATMSREEQSQVIRTVVQQARKRVFVIAGASSNSTRKAIQLSKMAAEAGADGLLHVTPYYNKPTPAGLLSHYRAIGEAVDLPLLLYNVPSRTGCDILPETVSKAAMLPHVVGIKEATGSIARAQQIITLCSKEFVVLSGDDATCLALTLMGGDGVISVISNILPKPMCQMIAAARAGQVEEARQIHYRFQTLMDLLFIESNPIPIKAALSLMGFCQNEVRSPLLSLEGDKLERLRSEMARLGLCS